MIDKRKKANRQPPLQQISQNEMGQPFRERFRKNAEVDPLVDYLKEMVVKDTDRRPKGRRWSWWTLPFVPGRSDNKFIGSTPHLLTVANEGL